MTYDSKYQVLMAIHLIVLTNQQREVVEYPFLGISRDLAKQRRELTSWPCQLVNGATPYKRLQGEILLISLPEDLGSSRNLLWKGWICERQPREVVWDRKDHGSHSSWWQAFGAFPGDFGFLARALYTPCITGIAHPPGYCNPALWTQRQLWVHKTIVTGFEKLHEVFYSCRN